MLPNVTKCLRPPLSRGSRRMNDRFQCDRGRLVLPASKRGASVDHPHRGPLLLFFSMTECGRVLRVQGAVLRVQLRLRGPGGGVGVQRVPEAPRRLRGQAAGAAQGRRHQGLCGGVGALRPRPLRPQVLDRRHGRLRGRHAVGGGGPLQGPGLCLTERTAILY
eukprot:3589356-Pyramimonas_sp.AAC.2